MDALAMYDAVKQAADDCRAGKGPVLLEANTYRFRGHSMADPAHYRSKQEVEDERENDPIPGLQAYIQKKFTDVGDDVFEAIQEEVKVEVDAAVKFADESPEPSLDELWRDTIVEEGEEDVHPRARVLGAKVNWPVLPGPKDFQVTWDLEPREAPVAESKSTPQASKSAVSR